MSHVVGLLDRLLGRRRDRPLPESGGRPRIHFLVWNAAGIGGIARTTITLANSLAETHDVRLVSLFRWPHHRVPDLHPNVELEYLFRRRPDAPMSFGGRRGELAARETALLGDRQYMSGLTDRRLRAAIAAIPPGDVLVSTRPSLHQAGKEWARPGVVRIGWDHLNYPTRVKRGRVMTALDIAVPTLDAWVVLTEADAEDYARRYPGTRIKVIRNACPWPLADPRPAHEEKVVVAAGRLHPVKGFDRLVAAWQLVQDDFPDWRCRVYGEGRSRRELQGLIDSTGARVELAGYTDAIRDVIGASGLLVLTSRAEGFPMVLVEAQSQGTPIVTFDCPRGPGEIVVDGSNGRLVPDGDVPALARALRELMADEPLRRRMGEQALRDAQRFEQDAVTREWAGLVAELTVRG